MATIDDLARAISRDLSPQFEQRLRAELAGRVPDDPPCRVSGQNPRQGWAAADP